MKCLARHVAAPTPARDADRGFVRIGNAEYPRHRRAAAAMLRWTRGLRRDRKNDQRSYRWLLANFDRLTLEQIAAHPFSGQPAHLSFLVDHPGGRDNAREFIKGMIVKPGHVHDNDADISALLTVLYGMSPAARAEMLRLLARALADLLDDQLPVARACAVEPSQPPPQSEAALGALIQHAAVIA